MKLIKMTGGLGNQMFIYAMYLNLKRRYKDIRIDNYDMQIIKFIMAMNSIIYLICPSMNFALIVV